MIMNRRCNLQMEDALREQEKTFERITKENMEKMRKELEDQLRFYLFT